MLARTIEIPTARAFEPLLQPRRYKGAYGGRGSGKSHFFAGALVEDHILNPGLRSVGIREVQKSIERSSKQLIVDKINQFNVNGLFDVQDQIIKTPGDGLILFQGMQNHTADSIKSLEGFDRAWVEEAQSLSGYSWRLLRPTLRKPGSEIWASWNPASPKDPVDEFYRGEGSDRDDLCAVRVNWSDNPWFYAGELPRERVEDQRARSDEYGHIWEGDYLTISDAIIFRRRVFVEDFRTPDDVRLFFGADWGFSKDPSAFIRCFIQDECLYIDYEAGGVGIEMDDLPAEMMLIPGAEKWPWKADGARPETISFLANRFGFKISAAEKWPGSVEDGIARMKAFKRIVVHPRCTNVAREFRLYSYKVDKRTEDILPVVLDANNHWIDACIAEGQLIWTARGHIPIEQISAGDEVMTRAGFKRVLAAVKTDENREVWEVKAGGKTLLATPDHRVFTANRGFVRVDALRYNDNLLIENDFVVCRVETVRAGHSIAGAVYDLTVEDQPEFFANGVLVHNCRYALDGIIQNRRRPMKFTPDVIKSISTQGRMR